MSGGVGVSTPTFALSLIFAARTAGCGIGRLRCRRQMPPKSSQASATSVPPLDHVRVSTRWQIFYFISPAQCATAPAPGGCSARQGRRQIKVTVKECTMYSTEPLSADLTRDCPQCTTGRLFSPLMAATSVPPLDHVRVSTRWQIFYLIFFTSARIHIRLFSELRSELWCVPECIHRPDKRHIRHRYR